MEVVMNDALNLLIFLGALTALGMALLWWLNKTNIRLANGTRENHMKAIRQTYQLLGLRELAIGLFGVSVFVGANAALLF
jgi:hypothetical protein